MNIFKISLPGNDVKRSRPDEEVINSSYSSPKVDTLANPAHAGIFRLNWQTSGLSYPRGTLVPLYSFPHHYNYIPLVLGNFHFDNGLRIVNGIMPFYDGNLGTVALYSDSKNINLAYYSTDIANTTPIPPFLLNVRFYVLAERGI